MQEQEQLNTITVTTTKSGLDTALTILATTFVVGFTLIELGLSYVGMLVDFGLKGILSVFGLVLTLLVVVTTFNKFN